MKIVVTFKPTKRQRRRACPEQGTIFQIVNTSRSMAKKEGPNPYS
jgi:hypothetical protein